MFNIFFLISNLKVFWITEAYQYNSAAAGGGYGAYGGGYGPTAGAGAGGAAATAGYTQGGYDQSSVANYAQPPPQGNWGGYGATGATADSYGQAQKGLYPQRNLSGIDTLWFKPFQYSGPLHVAYWQLRF